MVGSVICVPPLGRIRPDDTRSQFPGTLGPSLGSGLPGTGVVQTHSGFPVTETPGRRSNEGGWFGMSFKLHCCLGEAHQICQSISVWDRACSPFLLMKFYLIRAQSFLCPMGRIIPPSNWVGQTRKGIYPRWPTGVVSCCLMFPIRRFQIHYWTGCHSHRPGKAILGFKQGELPPTVLAGIPQGVKRPRHRGLAICKQLPVPDGELALFLPFSNYVPETQKPPDSSLRDQASR